MERTICKSGLYDSNGRSGITRLCLPIFGRPDRYINYGYNSLLASWALMNTGTKKTDFGYWYRGEQNDGAVGWAFSPYQTHVPI